MFRAWANPPHVRLLGPTIWSVAAVTGIYVGCATYEVYQDAKKAAAWSSRRAPKETISTFDELERFKERLTTDVILTRIYRPPSELPEFSSPEALTMGVMGLSLGVHLASKASAKFAYHFAHAPALPSNYTLLTSIFGHSGFIHLGINMYAMTQLMVPAAISPTLGHSNAHLGAFYLSAGILSSLANHATAVWPARHSAYMPALGASGALFALLGIIGVTYPTIQLGILLVPGSLPIGEALACIALFDAIGIFVRYPFIHLGHAAHLSGLALGVAGIAGYGYRVCYVAPSIVTNWYEAHRFIELERNFPVD
ncbi:hypothetical protein ONZ43_g4094 [Nemania bipapillata]|uniref:Uncharacterized protein n=1 Tax=Nemania bipapillata TaxID=110536 RepID=A0ACC2IRY5_9PEZI|nr:hypothetical protein ONZ43_g4094 [Nemania bipapillata]